MYPQEEVDEPKPRRSRRAAEPPETEAYTLQVFYDPEEELFRANFVEFPQLRVADESRIEAMYLAEEKLHSHLAALRQSGEPVPLAIRRRDYPTHIEIPVSQTLYRKLETRRHQERISMEQMVTEILTAAAERKAESPERASGGRSERRGGQQGSGKGNRQEPRGRGGNRRNFHETMDNRENFMEYVRNLEKGGGPGFKKR